MNTMKHVSLLFITMLLVTGCTSKPHQPVQWEYKTVLLNPFENGLFGRKLSDIADEMTVSREKVLSENGQQGWELVDIEEHTYFFKRPVVK